MKKITISFVVYQKNYYLYRRILACASYARLRSSDFLIRINFKFRSKIYKNRTMIHFFHQMNDILYLYVFNVINFALGKRSRAPFPSEESRT